MTTKSVLEKLKEADEIRSRIPRVTGYDMDAFLNFCDETFPRLIAALEMVEAVATKQIYSDYQEGFREFAREVLALLNGNK